MRSLCLILLVQCCAVEIIANGALTSSWSNADGKHDLVLSAMADLACGTESRRQTTIKERSPLIGMRLRGGSQEEEKDYYKVLGVSRYKLIDELECCVPAEVENTEIARQTRSERLTGAMRSS